MTNETARSKQTDQTQGTERSGEARGDMDGGQSSALGPKKEMWPQDFKAKMVRGLMEKHATAELLEYECLELIRDFLAKECGGKRASTRPEPVSGETNAEQDARHSEIGTESVDTYQEERSEEMWEFIQQREMAFRMIEAARGRVGGKRSIMDELMREHKKGSKSVEQQKKEVQAIL